MKNTWKNITIMMMTGVLAAGMSITANAATKEGTGSVTETAGIKSISAQYASHTLFNEAVSENAIWYNMAQKKNTDKKGAGDDKKQSEQQGTNRNTQKNSDTMPEMKTGQEERPAGKDDAANGISGEMPKDQSADKMPDTAASQASVPEKNEQEREEYVDVTAAQDAIDGLSDSDLQTSLQTLLDTYTDALDSEKAALDDTTSASDIESLYSAVLDAKKALLNALQDADINTENMSDPDMTLTENASESGSGIIAGAGSTVEKIKKEITEKVKTAEKNKNIFAKTVDAVGQTINNAGKWVSSLFTK